MRSLRASQRSSRPSSRMSVRRTSFAPAGFLISRIETSRPSIGMVSTRPNEPAKPSSASPDGGQRYAERQRRRGGGQRVVDVVEAREGEVQRELALGRAQVDVRALHALESHAGGGHGGLRSPAPAVRAAVAAQVAQVDRFVLVRMAAVSAVLRVRGVLHGRQSLGVVLEPEVGHVLTATAEVGHERVVGVQNEPRPAVELAHHLRPAVGQQLELSVAVELIAKEIGEQEQTWMQVAGHRGQPGLVDLEQTQLAGLAAGVEQRRGHSPGHVRARAVVHQRPPGLLEAGGDHGRGGGLAVGGRDEQRAVAELAPHAAQRSGRNPQQQAPRRRGAAAAPEAATRIPDEAGEAACHAEHQAGTTTRRQRGSTPIVAGVAPIGSPSA